MHLGFALVRLQRSPVHFPAHNPPLTRYTNPFLLLLLSFPLSSSLAADLSFSCRGRVFFAAATKARHGQRSQRAARRSSSDCALCGGGHGRLPLPRQALYVLDNFNLNDRLFFSLSDCFFQRAALLFKFSIRQSQAEFPVFAAQNATGRSSYAFPSLV